MYLIVGLGNPEPDYAKTRHNMGFDVINIIAKKYDVEVNKVNFEAMYGSININGEKIILVKPQTFMNDSGRAVKKYIDFYKIPLENLIVIYDDMDTDIGKIRVRAKGGPGTHNGMKSMVSCLSSQDFPRIRVGIGRPVNELDKINYVIGKIPEEEYKQLQIGEENAAKAVEYYIEHGIDNTMNMFNK